MAAVVSSYPTNLYHQPSYINTNLTAYYVAQYLQSKYYKPKPQKQQTQPRTPTPTKTIEPVDSTVQQLRPRREPRIRRQVIVLPTPEPIYRQVRHRLPTPERQVIQRTVIQKANGEVIVQQERHRKKTRSQSQSKTNIQARSPRTPQDKTD
jgi:hypothetical protein